MHSTTRLAFRALPAALAGSPPGYAATYLTIEQAQAAFFPRAIFTPAVAKLQPAQRQTIRQRSGVRGTGLRAWRAQFTGKTAAAPLTLGNDIRNITGGVKRLRATHELGLKRLR